MTVDVNKNIKMKKIYIVPLYDLEWKNLLLYQFFFGLNIPLTDLTLY